MTTPADFHTMTGLEAMQAIIDGRFPPPTISTTLGFHLSKVERGFALFVGEPSDRVVAEGRSVTTAETRLTDAQGKLYAHGTSTLLVLRPGNTS